MGPEADLYDIWQNDYGGAEAYCFARSCQYPGSEVGYPNDFFTIDPSSFDMLNGNDFQAVLCEDEDEDEDGDGVCDDLDECHNADDNLDLNGNSVPDDCDPCLLRPCASQETCLVYRDALHMDRKCVPKRGRDDVASTLLFQVEKQTIEPSAFAGLLTEVFAGILAQPSNRLYIFYDEAIQYTADMQIFTVQLLPPPLGSPPLLSAGTLHSQLENALRFQFFTQYDWGKSIEYTFDREVLVGWCEEELVWKQECAAYQEGAVTPSTASSETEGGQPGFTGLYIAISLLALVSLITFALIVKSRKDLQQATGYQAYKESPGQQPAQAASPSPPRRKMSPNTSPIASRPKISPYSSPVATRRRVDTVLATSLEAEYVMSDEGVEVQAPVNYQPSPRGKPQPQRGVPAVELTPAQSHQDPQSPGIDSPSPVPNLEQASVTQ